MFIGEGLISLQGFKSGADEFPPLGSTLLAAIPAGLVMIAPAVAAVVLGFAARRHGAASGIIPAVIGIVVVAYGILADSLPRLLGTRVAMSGCRRQTGRTRRTT
jgi:hypothetical protein